VTRLAGIVLLSRLVVLLAAVAAETILPRNPLLTTGDGGPILTSLTSWDGWWYLGIVRDGYHAAPIAGGYHDYAFLPLYPILVRILSLPAPGWEGLIAVVVANALFGVAIVLLVRLTEVRFGRDRAYRSAAVMALFPFSAAFSMAYAESLFMVLALGAFLAVERKKVLLAGVLLALATLTRLQGAVLVVPMAWLLWDNAGRPRPRLAWAALLLGPLAALAAFAWVVWLTGDTASYGQAQGGWGRLGLGGDPQGSLASGLTRAAALVHVIDLATLLFAVFLFVFVRVDRIPSAYVAVPVLILLLVVFSGSIQSIGRLLLAAFPYYWILGNRRSWLGGVGWPVASTVALFAISALMFAGWFVP
jgi:4-amino-4-deoxy-L-arabinose transferase-like glycosyltransferase